MKRADLIGLICGMTFEWGMIYALYRFEGPIMAISVAVGITGMVIYNCYPREAK